MNNSIVGNVQALPPIVGSSSWLHALSRYLLFVTVANLAWEILQLPLYTIWTSADIGDIAFAVIHCTGGDLIIATCTLVLALIFMGSPFWPQQHFYPVAAMTIGLGVAYTVFSEWLNIVVRQSWEYSEIMPVIPILDVGLSPFAQWIVIPLTALNWARRGGIGKNES
ncbi:MAG: hypothetical protein WBD34_12390 [Burkholderiaceae bacterium]